jgi:cellulose biosynthesis protein BcsQ
VNVLLVDADPQCNLTSFYIDEASLEQLLGESNTESSEATIWSAIKPVVDGRGGVNEIAHWSVEGTDGRLHLLPGDVLISSYEEELPAAWTDSFARKTRGYDVTTALAQLTNAVGKRVGADVILYDVGPNVGALNRAILLDCDAFITPVAADLFSLRALTTVGRAVSKWVTDWQTIRGLASPADRRRLRTGKPAYLGYVTSAYKVKQGRSAASPHADWEAKIAPRVRHQVVEVLRSVNEQLATPGSNKLGGIKNFQSLPSEAQKYGVPIGKLHRFVNGGHHANLNEARDEFAELAREIIRRADLN